MSVRIASIADHPELVELLGRWHFELWGHADSGGSVKSWTDALRARVTRDRVPTIYVALDGGEPLGSASLVEHDMDVHRHLTPWLSGVAVIAPRRGEGLGTALVRHAVARAAAIGVPRLYLYTESARGFYERMGWQHLCEDEYEGERVAIMARDTSAFPADPRPWGRVAAASG